MASAEFHELVKKLRSRPREENPTIEQLRAGFAALSRQFPPSASATFEPVNASGVPAEWVSVAAGKPLPVILYFHGGGYCIGSAQTHRDLVSRICIAAGARALSVDYRLAPEHPFPAAVHDGVAAYRWLRSQGVPATSIVIAGDSAGGGLALATLLSLKQAGDELPAGGLCMSPVTDLAKRRRGRQDAARLPAVRRSEGAAAVAYSGRHVGGAAG